MAETKFVDSYAEFRLKPGPIDTYIYNSGSFIDICGNISQGVGVNQRVGDNITMTSIQLKYVINQWSDEVGDLAGNTEVVPYFYLRCIIFIWKDETTPTPGDILEAYETGSTDPSQINIISPLNHDKRVKRKIIHDCTSYHYYAGNQLASWNTTEIKEVYYPIKNLRNVHYTSDTDGVNKLWILFLSNVRSSGEPDSLKPWNVYAYTRINYKDI